MSSFYTNYTQPSTRCPPQQYVIQNQNAVSTEPNIMYTQTAPMYTASIHTAPWNVTPQFQNQTQQIQYHQIQPQTASTLLPSNISSQIQPQMIQYHQNQTQNLLSNITPQFQQNQYRQNQTQNASSKYINPSIYPIQPQSASNISSQNQYQIQQQNVQLLSNAGAQIQQHIAPSLQTQNSQQSYGQQMVPSSNMIQNASSIHTIQQKSASNISSQNQHQIQQQNATLLQTQQQNGPPLSSPQIQQLLARFGLHQKLHQRIEENTKNTENNGMIGLEEAHDDNTKQVQVSNKRKLDNDNHNRPTKRRRLSLNNGHEFDYDELNRRYTTMSVTLDNYKKMNEELQNKINTLEFKSEKINTLNLKELNELKRRMQNKIKEIEEAETELIDNTYKCVACVDRTKNISFMDGCNHIALCDECETKLKTKLCPLCKTPYKNGRKLNF